MPPLTATWVRRAALDRDHLVERDHRAADDAAAGLDDQLRLRVQVLVQRPHRRLGVVGDRRRPVLGPVGDPEAAAEVVDGEAAERGDRLGGACRSRRGRAAASRCARAGRAARGWCPGSARCSAGASSSETPNLASGLPVSIAACVSPGTAGLTRSSTRCGGRRAARAGRRRRSCRSRSRPTPASSAVCMSRSLLALPCSRMCSGSKPAASAIASSPAEATSQPSPSSARMRVTGAHGSALEAKCTSVRAWRLANSRRYSRAVSRRPSSSTTNAGVPNSAATSASATPPIVSRPSLVSAVRGRTSKMPTGTEYSCARVRLPRAWLSRRQGRAPRIQSRRSP